MKKIVLFIVILLFVCGCGQNNINLNINDDNVVFSNKVLFNKEDFDDLNDSISIVRDEFKRNGYIIKKISDDGEYGYEIIKNMRNLDNLVSNNTDSVNLVSYSNDNKIFKRNNYILFYKYVSNFYIEYDEESLKNISLLISNEYINEKNFSIISDISSYFSIDSKYKIINSNSYNSIWNLNNGKNDIYFEFIVINTDVMLVCGMFVFLVIILSIIYIKTNNKKVKISKTSLIDSIKLEGVNDIKERFNDKDISALNNRHRN